MNEKNEKVFSNTVINWYPGHMAKTRREIKEKLDLIDIVYEVVDARMPISSKVIDMDEIIKNKPRILVVTKCDLCDTEETNKILEYYKSLDYTVIPVDLMSGKNVNQIIIKSNTAFIAMRLLWILSQLAQTALLRGEPLQMSALTF